MKKFFFLLSLLITVGLTAQQSSTQSKQKTTLCAGTTKAGNPCQMKVSGTPYCRYHNPNAVHCSGIKKDGTPCKMQVKTKGDYCYHHSSQQK